MSIENGRLTIMHVSDVHATHETLLYGEIDGLARLRFVGEYARHAGVTPEAVVVTGDLAQRGHHPVYADMAAACQELEQIIQAPVLTALGNHDEPSAARILPGHERGHARVVNLDAFRVIILDSHSGNLGTSQLRWLETVLRDSHPNGTIVALHHPPTPSPLPALEKIGLQDANDLEHALIGSDVRVILAGHYHHSMSALLAGIPVHVAPALSYQQIMNAGPEFIAGHDNAMFSLVRLTASGVQQSPVVLDAKPALFTIPAPHR